MLGDENEKTNTEQNQTDSNFLVEPRTQQSAVPSTSVTGSAPAAFGSGGFGQVGEPNKSKKKLWIGIGAAVGAIALIGGGVTAYMWYQNPNKVITDAMASLVMAKTYDINGNVTIQQKNDSSFIDSSIGPKSNSDAPKPINLTYKIKTTRYSGTADITIKSEREGKDISASGSILYDEKTDLYFKFSDIKNVVQSYLSVDSLPPKVQKAISTIEGKWYTFSGNDLKELSPESEKTRRCVNDVLRETEKDNKLLKEVGDVYAKNQFVIVKESLGYKNGNIGFVVDVDKKKSRSFGKEIKNTTLYKKLNDCSGNKSSSVDDSDVDETPSDDSKNKPRVELWVNQWSHQPAKVVVKSDNTWADIRSETTVALDTKFTITAPAGAASLKEFQKDIEPLMQSAYNGVEDRAKTSTNQARANMVMKKAEAYNALNGYYPTIEQLRTATDEARLDSDLKGLVSDKMPTAADASLIHYTLCSKEGGQIKYFDQVRAAVVPLTFGKGC